MELKNRLIQSPDKHKNRNFKPPKKTGGLKNRNLKRTDTIGRHKNRIFKSNQKYRSIQSEDRISIADRSKSDLSPTTGNLSLFLSLPIYRQSNLLMQEGGWGWARSQIIQLALYKSFNTL
jgi:hypothetical protein